MNDYLRIKNRSQSLLAASRGRQNKLRPRDVTVPQSTLRLDPKKVWESLCGCAIVDERIVKVFCK